jgi:hypothetical protein
MIGPPLPKLSPAVVRDILAGVGVLCVTLAIWLMSPVLGLLFTGICLLAGAFILAVKESNP